MATALPHEVLHREPTQGRQQEAAAVPAHGLWSMQQRHPPFLRWLLLASAVAALLIAFLGWHIYESHRFFGQVGTEFVRQTETIARVRKLRWELTQAAHHVVLFDDSEDRLVTYDDAASRLAAELDAGLALPDQARELAGLASLAKLAEKLGAIERKAMKAVRDSRQTAALDLLHSPEYMEATRMLCAEADSHAKSVYSRLQERLRSHGRSEFVFFSVDVAVLLFAAGLWWLLGLRLRRWRERAEVELSRRVSAEERLRQSQKMEALGQMAAGIGHDFKNVLSTITGYADLASRAAEQGSIDQASLRGIQAAAQQGAAVTGALLTFSHNTNPEREPVDLCDLLTETIDLLRQTLPASIEIFTCLDMPQDRCRILGDKNQLQQVLLNLALNAGDAMPTGGRLTVTLTTVEGQPGGAAPDDMHFAVCLEVSDTGKGIPADVKERIFEPFFTTKARGQSTGLGLAIVHAIAADHGATISVSSTPGEGATFRLCFPREDEASAVVPAIATARTGLVLIATRDQYEAQLLASAIGRIGFSTERIADWRGLVAALQRGPETEPTVLLDARFSGLGARACSQTISATGAHARVLILAERGGPSLSDYEDAGFILLERPLALAEVVRIVAGGAHR